MDREIGCQFYLDRYQPLEDKELNLDYIGVKIKDTVFLSTSNSGISFILEQNRVLDDEKIALLPSFTCSSIVEQFTGNGYRVLYYKINKDLSFNRELFLENLEDIRPSVIFVHGYFGFDTLGSIKDIIGNLKMTGVLVIEDITQTLYSNIEHTYADYYVFNFEKWTAVPEGEGIISSKKSFAYKPFEVDREFQEKRLQAMHAKYLYMNKGIGKKREIAKLFHEAEEMVLNGETIYAMGPVSKKIQANIDVDFLKGQRRKNYGRLYRGLSGSKIVEALFGELEEGIVPMCFPLYTKCNKIKLKAYLSSKDIYMLNLCVRPSFIEGAVDATAEWLYHNILAIPCDQRYSECDMDRIVRAIGEYEKTLN